MDGKVTDKIFEYIDALAAKLGVASEYVFEMLVRQQVIEGIARGSMFLVCSILIWVVTTKIVKHVIKNMDEIDGEVWIPLAIMSVIASIILFTLNAFLLPKFAMQIFNPEYYAIKEILDTISGK